MIESFGRTFLALGPPVILLAGTATTVLLALLLTGTRRWWALGVGPGLTLAAAFGSTWFVVAVLQPGEGSGFLLGAAALGLYTMGIVPYYAGLVLVAVWMRLLDRRWISDRPGR